MDTRPRSSARLAREMGPLDEALFRWSDVRGPSRAGGEATAARHTAQGWAESLAARGVPATVLHGTVFVPRVGAVSVPATDEPLENAARSFVAHQTDACRPWLVRLLETRLGWAGPRVAVKSHPGRLAVELDGRQVAWITQYSVSGQGFASGRGDLKADTTPLAALEDAIRRRVQQRQAPGTTRSVAWMAALRAALASRPGATAGALAGALQCREPEIVEVLAEMLARGEVSALTSPSGRSGYRLLGQGDSVPSGEPRSGPLREVADFLSEAGCPVSITPDGRIRMNATVVKPPAAALADDDARRRWLDAFVNEHLRSRLLTAVRENLPASGSAVSAVPDGDVLLLDRRGSRVASITATAASAAGATPLYGNFLSPHAPWQQLRAVVDDLAWGGAFVSSGLHVALPDGTDETLQDAASEATRRLRVDRTLVFAHEVRVDIQDVSLCFSPLTLPPDPLEVPFVLQRGNARFSGALRLRLSSRVMPCAWHQTSDPETLALAWTLALGAYAELTCVAQRPQRAASRTSTTRSGRASSGKRFDRTAPLRSPTGPAAGSMRFPSNFLARGETARYLASYVAGHRRQLQPGHQHSDEAAAAAAAVGIRLRADETWVRPHVRGMPADAMLHFRWAAPRWVTDAVETRQASRA